MLTRARIQELHDQYLALVKREVDEFGVKPTEVRHLVGRLGEFHCALTTGGELARLANQTGFDVLCARGRRISVKTTAQSTGFVSIKASTLNHVDDLMVVQYAAGLLTTLYYGPINTAIEAARVWRGNYELQLAQARKLGDGLSLAIQAETPRE